MQLGVLKTADEKQSESESPEIRSQMTGIRTRAGDFYADARGYLGFIQDVLRIWRFRFSNPHSYTKFKIINSMRKRTNAKILIESGTFLGRTASRCSSVFDHVYTIELDTQLAARAINVLAPKRNVTVIRGDATEVLPQLLQAADVDNVLVFLDGHFSGGITACGTNPEPAVDEMEQLSLHKEKIRAIIIDDFRCFGTEKDFPSKSDLLKSVERYFPADEFDTTVHLDNLIISRAIT